MSAKKKSKDPKKKLSKKQMKKLEKKRTSKREDGAAHKSVKKCDGVLVRKDGGKVSKKQEKAIRKAAKKLGKNLSSCGEVKKGKAAEKGKPSKKGQRNKGVASCSAASFKLNLGTCPCCSKHCPLSKPKCGKGRAVARKKQERLMGDAVA